MKNLFLLSLLFLVSCKESDNSGNELSAPGLEKPVEILRDSTGINHIYAQTEHDLFFAQGYTTTKDLDRFIDMMTKIAAS